MSKRTFDYKGGTIYAACLHQAKLALLYLKKPLHLDFSPAAQSARRANHLHQLKKEGKS